MALVMGLLPTWGDKVWKSTWGEGPEVFNPQNARLQYGRWLGKQVWRKEKYHLDTGRRPQPAKRCRTLPSGAKWRQVSLKARP